MSEEEIVNYPVVVIVGRPNVGKSTWFNRVIGEQAAIVEDRPGITRDRHRRMAAWLGVDFWIVDTGGWMPSGSELDDKVSRQVEEAVREADLVSFDMKVLSGVAEGNLSQGMPNGIDARTICALARYAGISDRVSIIGCFDLNCGPTFPEKVIEECPTNKTDNSTPTE